jgi:phage terminase large subunit
MKLNIKVTPLFERIMEKDERIVFLRGGARSSKSFSLMQIVVIWLYTGRISGGFVGEGMFTIIRMTFPALRATVYKDFIDYLIELDLYKFIHHSKSTNEFIYGKRVISFIPADSEQKLRGRKHTFAWLNEVNDIPYEVFHQVNIRTEKQVFMDVNPSGHPWARTEIEDKQDERGNVHVDVSTYHDNPFLSEAIKQEIEALKFTDPDLYSIYALGAWTELKGVIFPQVKIVRELPEKGRVYWAMDFGYNDPCVLVKIVKDGNDIYIQTLIYQSKLLLDEMAQMMLDFKVGIVYCDSSEPRTIEELKRRGVRAKAARKGPDSIINGITYLKQHNLHITQGSLKSIEEFSVYKWAEDSDGNMLDKPIDKFNHTPDAVRYALSRAMGGGLKVIA